MTAASVTLLKERGNKAFKAQQFAQAEALYSDAISECDQLHDPPDIHVLLANRAAARLRLGDGAGALQDASAAAAADPSYCKAHFRKGQALHALGQEEEACHALRAALSLEPGNKEVAALLAALAVQRAADAGGGTLTGTELPPTGACRAAITAEVLPGPLRRGFSYHASADGIDENLLILLHGLGDSHRPFAALGQRFALPQTAVLALSAPLEVPLTDGGGAWFTAFDDDYELIQPTPGDRRREESLQATLGVLALLLQRLQALRGWLRRRIHLFGFSQGGTLALHLALQGAGLGRLGSCTAVCASLLPELLPALLSSHAQPGQQQQDQHHQEGSHGGQQSGAAGRPASVLGSAGSCSGNAGTAASPGSSVVEAGGTPVLLLHATRDQEVSPKLVESTEAVLRGSGSVVARKAFPRGHGMIGAEPEVRECMQFWAAHLSRRPVAGNGETVVEVSR